MNLQEFSSLPLHDAVLGKIEVLWEKKLCNMHLKAFVMPGQNAAPHLLEFHGVTKLHLSQVEPWGPSAFVLNGVTTSGGFQLQMQSGDNIEVMAHGFTFIAL